MRAPASPIRILRLSRPTGLVTAQVFEELFTRHLGAEFAVRQASVAPWCRAVLGAPGAPWPAAGAARAFAEATRGADFLCPSYEAVGLLPLLAELRNRARAPVALLVIAHSPGAWPLEWALLAPLVRPGDRIVTPSGSAAGAVALLAPALVPWVRTVPHPVPCSASAGRRADGRPRLVSLGRLTPTKLLHRQLDAHALLRGRGRAVPGLDIAGETTDRTGAPLPYVRALAVRARRLGLADDVRFVGVVRGESARAEFLDGAAALVNLSVSVEESFGKAPAEALGAGVPVLVTRWNGLPETVGRAGGAVPVGAAGGGLATVDVRASDVADATARLLSDLPAAAACRHEAERFAPPVVRDAYRRVLCEALEERASGHAAAGPGSDAPDPDAPDPRGPSVAGGLLDAAPLAQLTWGALFRIHAEGCAAQLRHLEGAAAAPGPSDADRLRRALLTGTRVAMEHFFAGIAGPPVAPPDTRPARAAAADPGDRLLDHMAAAAVLPGPYGPRLACLVELVGTPQQDRVGAGLDALARDGVQNVGTAYLRVEDAAGRGDAVRALRLAAAHVAATPPGELGAPRLTQLARVARRAHAPAAALPAFARWLADFPDAPESGAIWLDRALLLCDAGGPWDEAERALARAEALLGGRPPLPTAWRALARAVARSASAASSAPPPATGGTLIS